MVRVQIPDVTTINELPNGSVTQDGECVHRLHLNGLVSTENAA